MNSTLNCTSKVTTSILVAVPIPFWIRMGSLWAIGGVDQNISKAIALEHKLN